MRIGIIGHFGGKEKFNDGQTVKTIAIYDALKRYGIEDVDKIDTYYKYQFYRHLRFHIS